MSKYDFRGTEGEVLYYTEWGYECGDLCEVCAEAFINMETEDDLSIPNMPCTKHVLRGTQ